MTRQIRRIATAMVVMFAALALNVSYLQVINPSAVTQQPGNQRNLLREYSRERGQIVVASSAIATSLTTADVLAYLRQYSNGPQYAAVTGFYSHVYGATGIERSANALLSGSDDQLLTDRITQLLAGRAPRGATLVLAINPKAQAAAWKALRGRTGAVVAIEPSTGRILALVSSPSYDPNLLAVHNARQVQTYYRAQLADPSNPMLNRPLARSYPPGSTFKLITAAAALATGDVRADTQLPGPAAYRLPGSTRYLHNWQRGACAQKKTLTLAQALAVSCNTAFAYLGNLVGADALRAQARAFGFDSFFQVPMTSATSRYPARADGAQTALSAIGQFDVQATALQMALVGAGIANDGVVMYPHLIDRVLAPDLSVLQETQPAVRSRAMTVASARTLRSMMVDVVARGTGGNARIKGVKVAGKTGTAQTKPGAKPHAWFVGIAPADNPQVAVSVVIENGGGAAEISGNKLAAPVARAVMLAVLK